VAHPRAAQRLNETYPWCISVVTYIELAQGCRDKAELARLKKGLDARNSSNASTHRKPYDHRSDSAAR
jgi:predicted nucleic acid-binding protein